MKADRDPAVLLALSDVDTGLLYSGGRWIEDPRFAQFFPDRLTVEQAALENQVKAAAIVLVNRTSFEIVAGVFLSPPP